MHGSRSADDADEQLGDVKYTNESAGLFGAGVRFGLMLPHSRDQELKSRPTGRREYPAGQLFAERGGQTVAGMDRMVPERGPAWRPRAVRPAVSLRLKSKFAARASSAVARGHQGADSPRPLRHRHQEKRCTPVKSTRVCYVPDMAVPHTPVRFG